jgi:protein-S-isoprenylcysteine O-methyltransferase Ste14
MPRSIARKWRIFVSRVFVAGLVVLVLISKSGWENGLWGPAMFLAGAVLIGFATVGRLWCSLYISGYKSDTLITTGPYSLCRNPLYFFSFLGATGVGLATETLFIPACIALAFAFYYPMVIKAEQRKLAEIHKEAFSDYCKRTPVFFPALRLLTEPEEYIVKPKIFRKTLFEVLWFVWLLGIIELKEAAEQAGLLPTIFKLY